MRRQYTKFKLLNPAIDIACLVGITSEMMDVLLDPLKCKALILEAEIESACISCSLARRD